MENQGEHIDLITVDNGTENLLSIKNYVIINDQLCEVEIDNNLSKNVNLIDESGIIENEIDVHVPEQEDYEDVEYLEEDETFVARSLTRKRQKNIEKWKVNKRKKLRQAGKEYISNNKVIPAKIIRAAGKCSISKCKANCQLISEEDRIYLFNEFYKIDAEAKTNFILSTTERNIPIKRTRNSDRKKFTHQYFFLIHDSRIRVCKQFYLGTLAVSQKSIYNAYSRKDGKSGILRKSRQGKHSKKVLSEQVKESIIAHIKSFPKISSHYCRKSSNKKYLEAHLSIRQMYNLYREQTQVEGSDPAKEHAYRNIFNNEFNFSFHVPKKDSSDLCEEYKVVKAAGPVSQKLENKYEMHNNEKLWVRQKRELDRQNIVPVICFDLQNVVTCLKAEIGSFYYLSKLNIYNLTGHLSTDKSVYCSIWNESQSGRADNDLASALIKILESIFIKNGMFTEMILWSDSCIPQNRNSIMSFAIINFMKNHPSIEKITMKFSTSGHSSIQEIDNVHSCFDRIFRNREFFSPVSFMRILTKAKFKGKLCNILQMRPDDFKNFKESSSCLNFKQIPFAQVVEIEFTQNLSSIKYKTSHNENETFTNINLKNTQLPKRNKKIGHQIFHELPEPKISKVRSELPAQKIKSFLSMIKFMPTVDREFFEHLVASKSKQN